MAEKKIWIMSEHGIKIPGSILGLEKDYQADAFEPVKVPESYGLHLIADRFAVETEAPKASAEKAKTGKRTSADDEAKALKDAEEAVASAEKQLADASDDVSKALAETALANATAALANLKAPA